ncbi:hypothetical protein SAMN05216312_114115 [Cohnella sp. OV330]|uniref:hypothetical protein n=1 Tax=Cohnella sp. OV330 TaxID=1855288 RepID=UPI0008E3E7B9|nr:hypothetical protein [Cohnella sp. OV330]SFB57819.1 hypothetical protein SAMN05216312_114115 [Cohnella sp. OV330]
MCTIGAIVCRGPDGNAAVLGFKNSDSPPVGYWHGIAGAEGGYASLAYGIQPQKGVNAGMNERGVMLISSYFGCEIPAPDGRPAESFWLNDLRGSAQAEALARCGTAEEALALMLERYRETAEPTVGGSHVIADRGGKLLVFEHEGMETAWHDDSAQGWAARSNQALGLKSAEQASLPEAIRSDRELRLAKAQETLASLVRSGCGREDAVKALASLLASKRVSEDGTGASSSGDICADGVMHGRSNAALPHVTLSGLIWDASALVMHYTAGRPGRAPWQKIILGTRGTEPCWI